MPGLSPLEFRACFPEGGFEIAPGGGHTAFGFVPCGSRGAFQSMEFGLDAVGTFPQALKTLLHVPPGVGLSFLQFRLQSEKIGLQFLELGFHLFLVCALFRIAHGMFLPLLQSTISVTLPFSSKTTL
jgi:hypothetical protein